ncbi:MAG: hypothetical protein FJ290_21500 [Planctomycetes bacterium]|nr:hypothetical protein [Planctomycetota bacterium]
MKATSFGALAVLITHLATGQLAAGERQIVLREHLNQQWNQELVAYPFEANERECHPASVTLTGPKGPVPVQLSQVECWSGTKWVKSAKLSFITSLAPLAKDTYTVRYGAEPAAAPAPATDLRVTPGDGQVEITTRHFGARLLLGEKVYPEPAAASEVPGPVVAMRLADGTWFGSSRLFGTQKIRSYSAKLIVAGPVFGEVECIYTYADGNTMRLAAQVAAGDNAILWDAQVKENRPQDGFDLLLTPGLPPLSFRVQMEFWTKREVFLKRKAKVGDVAELRLDEYPAGLITNLTPWPDWFNDFTQTTIPLKLDGRDSELRIQSRDAGVWVEPVPLDTPRRSPSLGDKFLPLMRGEKGEVFLRVNAAVGERRWSICEYGPDAKRLRPAEDRVNHIGPQPHGAAELQPSPIVGRRLNEVKDYVLDWPRDPQRVHPLLYLSREQLAAAQKRPVDKALLDSLRRHTTVPAVPGPGSDTEALGAYLLTGDRQLAAETKLAERLRHHLGLMGHFDKMRNTQVVVSLYDALLDSDLIATEERPLLRAQMAYLAYNLADPYTWSAERGYCSGNPNMTVAFVLNLGQLACAIPDHPMVPTWTQPAMKMMERWLDELGPEGEHPESVANYANVSVYNMLGFAIVARSAGLRDYIADPRMKKLMLFLAKQYTPPDPRYGGFSKLPPSGRGPVGVRTVLAGLMAQATQDSDPEYSRAQQWVWQNEGYPYAMEGRLGGYEYVYPDRALPAGNPGWTADLFPKYGAIFRHGIGTKDAYYVNFQVHMRDGYPSTNGSFPVIFAKGAPISTVFVESYRDREELLVSRVVPARRRGTLAERAACYYHDEEQSITDFAALARQDYAAVNATVKEPRRASHMGGSGTAAAQDLADMSIVQMPEWPPVPAPGRPPIAWRRQVMFVKDDDAAGANYLVLRDTVSGGQPTIWQFWTLSEEIGTPEEASRSEKPGNKVVEPREFKGNRFTALGQFGVDVEYFVAVPEDTPRYTLRCGEEYGGQAVYQDLLHLQLPGDGSYYVALFPRKRAEDVPTFAVLGNGTIIKVSGNFGTDFCFLSGKEAEASGGGVFFRGTAASVQDRKSLVLSLGAKGEVRYKDYGLAADAGASLRIEAGAAVVEAAAGRTIRLRAPGEWKVAEPRPGVALTREKDQGFALAFPAGVATVRLVKR